MRRNRGLPSAGTLASHERNIQYTFESVGHMRRDANFTLYMCLGFLIAYVLSVVIEGALLVSWARKYGCGNPFKVALVGNTFSYVFLAAGSILYMSV